MPKDKDRRATKKNTKRDKRSKTGPYSTKGVRHKENAQKLDQQRAASNKSFHIKTGKNN